MYYEMFPEDIHSYSYQMNRILSRTFLLIAAMLAAVSCFNRSGKAGDNVSTAVIDSLAAGDPFRLCEQTLTSIEALESVADTTYDGYDRELTPMDRAFFYMPDDLKDSGTAQLLMRRYNICTVINHVVHGYELFCRKSSDMAFLADDDSTVVMTKADTLALIAEDRIPVPSSLLARALPDAADRKAAGSILAAYDRFDGDDSDGSPFSDAFVAYREYFATVPEMASEELLDEFSEKFWDWYDKKPHVAEIDMIQELRVEDRAELSDEQMEHFRQCVESEKDIDRRAILALEYAKWDTWYGAILLGEILESGQYTRYLFEAWITWRASVQMAFIGPSSFTVIPNNYYDQVRVKCLETMFRHYESNGDSYDLCMLENLLVIPVLHRQGSLAGNESMKTLAELQYGMFVHPRVTEKER